MFSYSDNSCTSYIWDVYFKYAHLGRKYSIHGSIALAYSIIDGGTSKRETADGTTNLSYIIQFKFICVIYKRNRNI